MFTSFEHTQKVFTKPVSFSLIDILELLVLMYFQNQLSCFSKPVILKYLWKYLLCMIENSKLSTTVYIMIIIPLLLFFPLLLCGWEPCKSHGFNSSKCLNTKIFIYIISLEHKYGFVGIHMHELNWLNCEIINYI